MNGALPPESPEFVQKVISRNYPIGMAIDLSVSALLVTVLILVYYHVGRQRDISFKRFQFGDFRYMYSNVAKCVIVCPHSVIEQK